MITLITGGVRSGKSRYAQEEALRLDPAPVYVATAEVLDPDFAERVQRHRDERGPEWTTYEAGPGLASLPLAGRTVVIDCVTLWLTRLFGIHDHQPDPCLAAFKGEVDALCRVPGNRIIISNELGMGLHAETAMGRRFTDLQGWANQYVASLADQVVFMVSGIPLYIKKPSP